MNTDNIKLIGAAQKIEHEIKTRLDYLSSNIPTPFVPHLAQTRFSSSRRTIKEISELFDVLEDVLGGIER